MPFGSGDQWVADRLDLTKTIIVVNKTDIASKDQVFKQLIASSGLDALAYFPVSAKSGHGVAELVAHISQRMPEGPMYYPDDILSDLPEADFVAELVREQLLAATHDELPYSIANDHSFLTFAFNNNLNTNTRPFPFSDSRGNGIRQFIVSGGQQLLAY